MAAKTFRELTANTAPASDRIIATQAPSGSAEPEKTTLAQLGGSLPFNLGVTGSVERSLAAKVGEIVSVEDFGAVGDGVADDTEAFQAAVNYLASRPQGGNLEVPFAHYRVSNLVLKDGVYMRGIAANGISGGGPNIEMPRLQINGEGVVIDTPDTLTRSIGIHGLMFSGLGSSSNMGGVRFRNVNKGVISSCFFDQFSEHAILQDAGIVCVFDRNFAQNCLRNRTRAGITGVFDIGGTDHEITGGEASASVTGSVTDSNLYCAALVLRATNCFVQMGQYEISDVGAYITGAYNKILGTRVDLNMGHGIVVSGSGNVLIGVHSHNNGQAETNTYDGFQINGVQCVGSSLLAVSSTTNRHRYGINSTFAGDNNKSTFDNCVSFGATTRQINIPVSGIGITTPVGPTKQFTDLDQTPSVSMYGSFKASYTSATTITNFDDGFNGQRIIVVATNGNLTFANNSTIVTGTGGDLLATTGAFYTFVLDGTVWRRVI